MMLKILMEVHFSKLLFFFSNYWDEHPNPNKSAVLWCSLCAVMQPHQCSLCCIQHRKRDCWRSPQGKETFLHLFSYQLQQLLWRYSGLYHQHCWHKSKLLHVGNTGLGRRIGYSGRVSLWASVACQMPTGPGESSIVGTWRVGVNGTEWKEIGAHWANWTP